MGQVTEIGVQILGADNPILDQNIRSNPPPATQPVLGVENSANVKHNWDYRYWQRKSQAAHAQLTFEC